MKTLVGALILLFSLTGYASIVVTCDEDGRCVKVETDDGKRHYERIDKGERK